MSIDVVVACCEKPDWVLVVLASRGPRGRSIAPIVYTTRDSLLYAVCPNTRSLRVANNNHEDALNAMVAYDLQVTRESFRVLEVAETGFLNHIKAWPYGAPLQDFTLQQTPTFNWMYSALDDKGFRYRDDIDATLRLSRYLIDKHHLGDWTNAEKERAGTIAMMKGKQYV